MSFYYFIFAKINDIAMLEITAEEFNKFSNLNDKVRKVEVRAKDYLLQLEPLLQKKKKKV